MVNKTEKELNMDEDRLIGMKEICGFMCRSEPTVLDLIRNEGLPAQKIDGVWESSRGKIKNWKSIKTLVSTLNGGR